MKTLSTFIAVFALATAIKTNPIKAPPAEEQVTALKGIDDLNISMWSGFINIASTSKEIHYVYIETTAANKTGDEPLVAWFNGGPGCSSMLAMFQENGPFLMNTPTQALNYNEWSWTDFANVVCFWLVFSAWWPLWGPMLLVLLVFRTCFGDSFASPGVMLADPDTSEWLFASMFKSKHNN